MPGSDNERTFVPAELDVLEDALEQSLFDDVRLPTTLDNDARARVHGTLIHYRAIQRHAQALLLRDDPPAAVLAHVLAQARAAVAAPVTILQPRTEASLWSKLKAVWYLPSIAAVGGAAIVLVMFTRPRGDTLTSDAAVANETSIALAQRSPSVASPTMPALADASASEVPAPEEARGGGLFSAKLEAQAGDNFGTAQTAGEGAVADDAKTRSARVDAPVDGTRKSKVAPAPKPSAAPARDVAPGASPAAPTPESDNRGRAGPEKPSSPQDQLERANQARRSGDCDGARTDYQQVVVRGSAKQRAQARAGLALCLERSGEAKAAKALIEQARADDPGIDGWLDAQR